MLHGWDPAVAEFWRGTGCTSALACILGLRADAEEGFRAIAGLSTWKVLAFPRERSIGVGGVSSRRLPCNLTCAVHSEAT
jgi:hypothetical protein